MASKRKQGDESPNGKTSINDLSGESKRFRVDQEDYKSWGVDGVSEFLSERGFSSEICAKFISKFFSRTEIFQALHFHDHAGRRPRSAKL